MVETMDTLAAGALTSDDVRGLCGDLLDWKLHAILETGADAAELETALAWAAGDDAILTRDGKALSGRSAEVYEILTADDGPEDER